VSDIAKAAHPTPSAFEFSHRLEVALQEGAAERNLRLWEDLLRKYNVNRVEALPVSFSGISLQAGEDHGNEVFDRFYSELWDTFHRQEQIHLLGSLAAPLLAVRSLSMSLAGTDFAQHADFARAAEEYRRMIQRKLNSDITTNAAKVSGPYLRDSDLWATIPDFVYEAPGTTWVVSRQWPAFALLTLWMVGAVLTAMIAALKLRND
jgi:ABC-2 type transport system permease protein